MSPESPRFNLPESKPDNNPEKKKKHRKKGAAVPLPSIISLENEAKDKSPKPEKTRLDDALANLFIEKGEPSKKAEKADKKDEEPRGKGAGEDQPAVEPEAVAETGTPEAEIVQTKPEIIEKTDKTEKAEKSKAETDNDEDEEYEALRAYEPAPVEFSGGEVIIHLQGDTPVAERVIPLEAEAEPEAAAEEAAKPAPAAFEVPIFTRQPEQQHQARNQETAPEPEQEPERVSESTPAAESNPTPGAGGEVPPVPPPEAPPAFFAEPPEQPRPTAETIWPRPEDIYQNQAAVPNLAGAQPETQVTKQELEDAIYNATSQGLGRGIATGLVVGGAYEHFRHKRREKKQAKRFKRQEKKLDSVQKDYNYGLQEQDRLKAENDRRVLGLQKELDNKSWPEKMAAPASEQRPVDASGQQPAGTSEQLAVPTDHRLETSAWHTIEIDSKTGKAVENPAFQYGQEYYRERAKETTPVAQAQRSAVAGEVAQVATIAAGIGAQPSPGADNGTLPSVNIPSGSQQSSPQAGSSPSGSSSRFSGSKPADNSADAPAAGPIWPWLVALLVIIVCLVALLH